MTGGANQQLTNRQVRRRAAAEITASSGVILCDDKELLVRAQPGEGHLLVVAFTGIGHALGSIQREEFAASASSSGANHVVFVTDRLRSWYSRAGLAERIIELIAKAAEQARCEHIVTLGNSMGGFGALLFAERIRAQTAIAFAPQYTMDRRVIDERRWANFRPEMDEGRLAKVGDHLTGATRAHAVFAGDASEDVPHREALDRTGNVRVHVVKEGSHDVAGTLKARGALAPLISAMIARDDKLTDTILAPFAHPRQAPAQSARGTE